MVTGRSPEKLSLCNVGARFAAALSKHFSPRELIVRSDGKIKYVRLSTRSQLVGASLIGGIAVLSLATSIGLAMQQVTLHGRDIAVREAEGAYTGLLAEVADYFDQFKGSTGKLGDDEAYLLGLSGENAAMRDGLRSIATQIEGPTPLEGAAAGRDLNSRDIAGDDPLRAKLRDALKNRLQAFDSDLKRIAARNQSLTNQIADLKSEIRGIEGDRRRMAAERDELTALLDQSRQSNGSLASQVADLTGRLTNLQRDHDTATAQVTALNAQVASLQGELQVAQASNADLSRQVAQTKLALSTVINQRNSLQLGRSDLGRTIDELRDKVASVQESQANFVASVTERTRNSLEEMEKTLEMTGLNVEGMISAAEQSGIGKGGPFIPDPATGADETEQKLLANVATLDDEVARWEKMQVVLRSVPLAAPVDHYYISSGFGARVDPFNGARARHEGLDMVGTLRSDVLATAPGTVVSAGWKGNYGRVVEIDHGLGIHTLYAHLDSVAVKVGDVVDYRQLVGKLGSSGRSSGPHCHYEVRYNDKPLDPMGFLKAGRYVFKG
ncbi:peptidoglycan DD-metalloendopeptidase family protein [Dongia rigui]|uniref:Peptidoglycan DD-metalloendopeptidase family protein n=1 Tax=Dongia rigui TaxID=940149 RepID=A0ABU5DZT1_9PROT|nr:peptidoglycan DD-metalloendopeptidase family protein [Dongia rigui]MDY0872527.1 peptidoglycan DD-metalloendopeptidase family protein [Dongia rigui]